MGAGLSSQDALADEKRALSIIAGPSSLTADDPVWNELLSSPAALATLDPADIEAAIAPHCRFAAPQNSPA